AWEKVKENRGSGGVDGQTLAAFDREMRLKGYQLTRYADDWYHLSIGSGGTFRSGSGPPNPETAWRGITSAENADCPCPAWLRVPRLSNQARVSKALFAREQDS